VYILDLGVWFYLFLLVVLALALFIWSVVLWLVIVMTLVCTVVVGFCMVCAEGGGHAGGDCGACDCFGGGCGECCGICAQGHAAGGGDPGIDMFYYGFYNGGYYPMPYSNCSGLESADCRTPCCCLAPLAWLFLWFPMMPENAHGGLSGRLMGTHQLTTPDQVYQGGNPLVDFLQMRWMRRYDLHDDQAWRKAVFDFIYSMAGETPADTSLDTPMPGTNSESHRLMATVDGQPEYVRVGRAIAIRVNRAFDEEDRCIESSFEDYVANTCWICQEGNAEWDMWMSCHHLFCKKCSEQMLRRNMPCPLCRMGSTIVKRGLAAP